MHVAAGTVNKAGVAKLIAQHGTVKAAAAVASAAAVAAAAAASVAAATAIEIARQELGRRA